MQYNILLIIPLNLKESSNGCTSYGDYCKWCKRKFIEDEEKYNTVFGGTYLKYCWLKFGMKEAVSVHP